MKNKKPWGGRFSGATSALVEQFTESISFDRALAPYDIRASIAHCRMLGRQGIIAQRDARRIERALREIGREIEAGTLAMEARCEDIHMCIEARLIEKIGPVGGKLHTARSRNDQVATDVSLYLRDAILNTRGLLVELDRALVELAARNMDAVLPGFTHMQHAQPVLLAHHLLAYHEMFARDCERLESCYRRVNRLPLGAGALAGTPYPVDRRFVAAQLGYPAVSANSMDTVSDRDHLIEFSSAAALIMMHLSRLCEELILWSTPEFAFVEIADAFCTGSSIMPQKKNPDVPEIVRGKTGRVYGNLMALLTLMKALPLAYNRDLQEDKERLFDTVTTVQGCLRVFAPMLGSLRFNREAMRAAAAGGFLTATDLADYLVRQGMPFRSAHEVVGRIVAHCERAGTSLFELDQRALQKFSPAFGADAPACLSIEASVASRRCEGGTAPARVRAAVRAALKQLERRRQSVERELIKINAP
ncbi:MAG: argininosuccinate lyase [Deltaproteobacteria bacterium]|nr:argininosuccinate lyase [Deltaproteobacteria bacterium]